jgi:hypothetical protein
MDLRDQLLAEIAETNRLLRAIIAMQREEEEEEGGEEHGG